MRSSIWMTAGSKILNISCGYTPNTTMAMRNGDQAIHSVRPTSWMSSWCVVVAVGRRVARRAQRVGDVAVAAAACSASLWPANSALGSPNAVRW